MSRMRHSTPLHLLGLVSSLWLVLAGCGGQHGSDGSGGGGSTAPRVRHLTLQLTRAPEGGSPTRPSGRVAAQVRQVQPGDPAFLQRLDLRIQTPQGVDLLAPQEFPLGPAEQETVVLDIMIPEPPPAESRILVTAFNNFHNQQTAIFLGQVLLQRGQESATLTLVRNPDPTTLIPVVATPASLQQTVFPFLDGAVFGFGLGGVPVTLTTGSFQGTTGTFTLAAGGGAAGGQLTLGPCAFLLTVSTFPPGQGPQVGDRMTFDPCEVDAVDGRLTATNGRLNIRATSEAPSPAAPTEVAVVLPPTPPTLETEEDTPVTAQVEATLSGGRPGRLSFAITEDPAQGTAGVDTTGLLTYRPAAQFHGSDHLVVTVTATFSDGALPLFVLGGMPIAITVRSLNDPPSLSNPGPQTTPEGATVTLALSASDVDGDAVTFSATGLPPGLSLNATTGLISGTVATGAAAGSPYGVTGTVSDGMASGSVSFTWTVPTTSLAQPSLSALTVVKAGNGSGTVTNSSPEVNCGPTCSAAFNEGIGVTLTATAASGSTFTGWSGEACGGTDPCAVIMSQARNVPATFVAPSGHLYPGQKFAVGTRPGAVVVVDINGDGHLDLVVANYGLFTGDVSVLLGNGDGTFQAQQSVATGTSPVAVVVADVNGDGYLDLITANGGSNDVSVLLGKGNGTFQAEQSVAAGTHPVAVAVADVNGDGYLDLVVANAGSNDVSVLLGNGNGTFQTQ